MLRRGRARIICKKIQRILKKGNMVWYKRNIRSAVGVEAHFPWLFHLLFRLDLHELIVIKNRSARPYNGAIESNIPHKGGIT
jgi:hypothetical protein